MPNITLKDIADVAGVSQNTVSLVLRGKRGIRQTTRDEILRIANELGYMHKGANCTFWGNIGIVLSLGSPANAYFHTEVLEELEIIMRERGYNIVLINKSESSTPESISAMIAMNAIRGVVVLGDIEDWVIDTLSKNDLPYIATGFFSMNRPFDCVLEDNVVGSLVVMHHLDQLGYRNIGYIGSIYSLSSLYERYMVYRQYIHLNSHMGTDVPAWTDDTFEQLTDPIFLEKKVRECENLPDAFFCRCDKIAVVLLKALYSIGYKVPEDIGVVGFDNNELAQLSSPTLTSVDTFYALQAQRTATEIIRKIEMNENKSTIGRILTKVKLVEGKSLRKIQ